MGLNWSTADFLINCWSSMRLILAFVDTSKALHVTFARAFVLLHYIIDVKQSTSRIVNKDITTFL